MESTAEQGWNQGTLDWCCIEAHGCDREDIWRAAAKLPLWNAGEARPCRPGVPTRQRVREQGPEPRRFALQLSHAPARPPE